MRDFSVAPIALLASTTPAAKQVSHLPVVCAIPDAVHRLSLGPLLQQYHQDFLPSACASAHLLGLRICGITSRSSKLTCKEIIPYGSRTSSHRVGFRCSSLAPVIPTVHQHRCCSTTVVWRFATLPSGTCYLSPLGSTSRPAATVAGVYVAELVRM